MKTDRDLRIEYVNKDEVWCVILNKYIMETINRNAYSLAYKMADAYRDGVHEICIDEWCNEAYDHLISEIDWSILEQCKECHAYFDVGEGTEDGMFCSDDCQEIYVEEPPDDER